MATHPSAVAGSSTTPPPTTPAHSEWNNRMVQVALGLGVLGVAIYIIHELVESTPSKPKTDLSPDPERVKFVSEQHRSGLRWGEQVCFNEAKALNFAQYAEAIIRIEPFELELVDPNDFFITCSPAREFPTPEPYFEQRANPAEGLEFFVPNLPLNETIKVTFGSPQWKGSLNFHVTLSRGLYKIFKENYDFQCKAEPLPPPTIYSPVAFNPTSLKNSIFLKLSENGKFDITTEEKGQLTIKNPFGKSVVYLQLTSKRKVISTNQRDLVLPFVIGAEKTKTFSHKLLDILWKNTFRWATSKQVPEADLDLHLSGYQQMIYTPLTPLSLSTPEKPA